MLFCSQIKEQFKCSEKVEFCSCSWEKGWNIKFKKAGKTLCTIYPREGYFTVMVVIGRKEKDLAETLLADCTSVLKEINEQTKEGNGQRWLMVEVEDGGSVYDDIFRLIKIRQG